MNAIKSLLGAVLGLIGATVVLWIWRLAVALIAGAIAKYVFGAEFFLGAIGGLIVAVTAETLFDFRARKLKRRSKRAADSAHTPPKP